MKTSLTFHQTTPRRRITRSFILIMAVLLSVVTFGGHLPVAAQNSAQSDATTVRIAFMGSSQGTRAAVDQALYQAAVLAAEQANSDLDNKLVDKNGSRYALDVHFYPANSSADLTAAYNDARDDGALALLGPDDSDMLNTLLGQVTPGFAVFSASADTPIKDKVFRLSAAASDNATSLADYLVNHRRFGKIAVVAADSTQAQAGVRAFTTKAGSANIALTVKQAADKLDFSAIARDIQDKNADALYIWLPDAQVNALLDALQNVGWNKTVISQSPMPENMAQSATFTDLLGASACSAAAYDNLSQQFVADYQAKWNALPPDNAAAYYDAVKLIAESLKNSGKDRTGLLNSLRNKKGYRGVQGVYNSGAINALRLMQTGNDNARLEAASYSDGKCINCSDDARPDVSGKTVSTSKTLTFALIGTLNGVSKPIGDAATHGAELAVDAINARGGVLGPNNVRYLLTLNRYNATNSSEMASAFVAAKSAGATVVLGPDFNGQLLPQLTLASSQGIPQLVTATSAQILGKTGQNFVFQARANDLTLARAAADYLVMERSFTKFGTFAIRADYGLTTAKTLKDFIATLDDARVTLALDHAADATNSSDYAVQIAASGVQALFVWTSQPAAKQLLDELGKAHWQGVFVYGYLTPDYAATLTVPSGISLMGTVTWWNIADDWSSRDFTARFAQRYGSAPLPQSAAYYDAVFLLAQGIEKVGSDPKALQSWLAKQTAFRGVQGMYAPATYADGESVRSALLISWDGSAARELARYDNGSCWSGCNPRVTSRYHKQTGIK